jgi:heptosyltransferase-2
VGTAADGVDEVVRGLAVPAMDLTGKTDLATLAAVLERCCALVCNDGGVMHLATAVGTPTVAVFGPSNPIAWGPWPGGPESPHRVVALNIPCRPCFYVGHRLGARNGCPTRDCLAWLKPEWVVRALDDVLAGDRYLATPRNGA